MAGLKKKKKISSKIMQLQFEHIFSSNIAMLIVRGKERTFFADPALLIVSFNGVLDGFLFFKATAAFLF